MSLKIVGLSEINGPLVALEGIHDAGYEEMVELEPLTLEVEVEAQQPKVEVELVVQALS